MVKEKIIEYGGLKYLVTSDGRIKGCARNKLLKQRINKDGYAEVTMGSGKYRNSRVRVHRIIAECFCYNDDIKNKTEVNHKDFNRLNNDYSNLEWMSHKDNIRYSVENTNHYNSKTGNKNGRSRLTWEKVRKIRLMIQQGVSCVAIAKLYDVGESTIYNIKYNNTWKE